MFNKLNKAFLKASEDKVYNIILALIILIFLSSFIFKTIWPYIFALVLSFVEIGIIIKFWIREIKDGNNK